MKSIIIFLLSCMSLLATDDIGVSTTIRTNAQTGEVITTDCFTRGGQTNLLCKTTTTNGVFKSRSYRFYHDGKLTAEYLFYSGTGFSLTATHYEFDATFMSHSNLLYEVDIYDQNRQHLLDVFEATNGILSPFPTSELRQEVSVPDEVNPKTNNVKQPMTMSHLSGRHHDLQLAFSSPLRPICLNCPRFCQPKILHGVDCGDKWVGQTCHGARYSPISAPFPPVLADDAEGFFCQVSEGEPFFGFSRRRKAIDAAPFRSQNHD